MATRPGDNRPEHQIQELAETKCQPITSIPVNIIVHGIDYVNRQLEEGQFFFTDIKKEGILLYDAGNVALAEQRELTAKERREIAQRDFDMYFDDGKNLLASSIFNKDVLHALKTSVFLLHQSAERFYNSMILAFTGYKSGHIT